MMRPSQGRSVPRIERIRGQVVGYDVDWVTVLPDDGRFEKTYGGGETDDACSENDDGARL